jgi:hypothetical protein
MVFFETQLGSKEYFDFDIISLRETRVHRAKMLNGMGYNKRDAWLFQATQPFFIAGQEPFVLRAFGWLS